MVRPQNCSQGQLMIRLPRVGLALAAALALSAPSFAATAPAKAPAARPAAAAVKLAPGQWPQAISDLKPDPAIRFGALPNGMRYALRKQAIPPGQTSLRLWFDAGSMMETDQQQ